MRTVAIVLLTLSVVLPATLYCQTQSAAQTPVPTAAPAGSQAVAVLTVDERLSRLESKLDQLSVQIGKANSRTSLYDFVERRFSDLEKKLDEILRITGATQADVRRMK